MAGAEKSQNPDDDQINSNNVVQKFWCEKYDNSGNDCQHWANANVQMHKFPLSFTTAFSGINSTNRYYCTAFVISEFH